MNADEKLAAILAAVQVDPGNRGLANLFHHFPHDFANACRSIAVQADAACLIHTGFFIPSAEPPAFETDGPLGAVFLVRAFDCLGIHRHLPGEWELLNPIETVLKDIGVASHTFPETRKYHVICLERAGPAADGRCYTMRGRDVTSHMLCTPHPVSFQSGHGYRSVHWYECFREEDSPKIVTIGIGDGGNEVGMGKLPHQLVVDNIPNGDLIHCRTATDHLIVAGVSNWGAYALAAGLFVLRGVKPPSDLFDPDRERTILEAMVKAGPLVDGVTGKPTATVDGLTWDEYVKPLIRIREILGQS